jgi:hypothetical protein
MMQNSAHSSHKGSSIFAFTTSILIAFLTAIASIGGLLNPDYFYPTEELRQFALANDVTNLLIGLPILLGSIWFDHHGKYLGRLLWPGALMYTLYNYLAYAIALPVSWIYLAYLLIVALCLYSLVAALANIDVETARRHIQGEVPERFSASVLILLGGFVFLRVIGVIASAQLSASEIGITERALLVADILLAPAWILGGALLWKKRPLGYAGGLALLFQGSMLFIGLIIVLALQPIFTTAPFPWVDIIVVTVMGLVCFVPFILFLHGISRR